MSDPLSTHLCLIRHGETAWNAEARMQGHLDVPLSARGHAQAKAVAERLEGERFCALYSSDLGRALQTAAPVAERLGLAVQPLAGLRERHCGVLQGLTFAEFERRHPEAHARVVARDVAYPLPGGGESLEQFAQRIGQTLDALAARHRGERVLIVSHGGALDMLYRRVIGQSLSSPRRCRIPNAGINRFAVEAQGWQLLAWAECGHLEAALDEIRETAVAPVRPR